MLYLIDVANKPLTLAIWVLVKDMHVVFINLMICSFTLKLNQNNYGIGGS